MVPLGILRGILELLRFFIFSAVIIQVGGTPSSVESKGRGNGGEEGDEDLLLSRQTWKTPNGDNYPQLVFENGEEKEVRIGSFNLRKFGRKKSANEEVLKIIARIIARYDLIALQGITDVKGLPIPVLMGAISEVSNKPYHLKLSQPVGRTKQKELYGLLYRPDIFEVKQHILYDDSDGDAFAREPQIAEIYLQGEKIALVNVHVAPGNNASSEIDSLTDVHNWVEANLTTKNIVILGDLYDCDYIRRKDKLTNRFLSNDSMYKWLIPNDMDTTVGNTSCAYDRIIISGQYLEQNLKQDSAGVFKFDKEFKIDHGLTSNVSDHYPVEFSIMIRGVVVSRNKDDSNSNPQTSSSSLKRSFNLSNLVGLAIALILRNTLSN